MSQPYVDWEIVESHDYGSYRYVIIRALREDGVILYKGWIVYAGGKDYWLEDDTIQGLRSALTNMGQQA